MNRKQRRTAKANLRLENRQKPDRLIEIPRADWPYLENKLLKVFRSKKYLVQVYEEENNIFRLSICRTELNNSGDWKDGITWDELQEIKTQCGYGNSDAVEIYPKDIDIKNVSNMRHLWVLPYDVSFAWRERK